MADDPQYTLQSKAMLEAQPLAADRWVLNAALTIGVGLAVMLALDIVDQFSLLGQDHIWLLWLNMAAGAVIIVALVRGAGLALREMRERRRAAASADEARGQVETLFKMTDMLQSALVYADANAVLRSTTGKLLNGFGGALYVFNNSGDRLDLSIAWGWPDGCKAPDNIIPADCWALKRGKPHFNEAGEDALLCEHHHPGIVALEIPMMARGEVYGLLKILATPDVGEERLRRAQPLAAAIADAMSLALSNIALREKLRTQALRDPLTGLYNRRYMEDVLDRYANIAGRNGSSLSVIMIDLDHFKRLNDEHGHALGDAMLRDVASTIMGAIRPSDVACRFGGEELLVVLPECDLDDALGRAETLRVRIEQLSENRAIRITASLGVASIPGTSAETADLIRAADAALYEAKSHGRNRVAAAPPRPGGGPPALVAAAE